MRQAGAAGPRLSDVARETERTGEDGVGRSWIGRTAVMLVSLFGAACGDGLTDTEREVARAYELVAIDGAPLPFELDRPCGESAAAGFVDLGRESRFFLRISVLHPDCPEQGTQNWSGTGLWTRIGDDIRFVSDPVVQALTLGLEPAPLSSDALIAAGSFEVVGYEGTDIRPTLEPIPATFTFAP